MESGSCRTSQSNTVRMFQIWFLRDRGAKYNDISLKFGISKTRTRAIYRRAVQLLLKRRSRKAALDAIRQARTR